MRSKACMKAPVLDKNPSILTGEKAVCVDTNAVDQWIWQQEDELFFF